MRLLQGPELKWLILILHTVTFLWSGLSHMAPNLTANEGEESERGFCEYLALSLSQLTKCPSQYFPTHRTLPTPIFSLRNTTTNHI